MKIIKTCPACQKTFSCYESHHRSTCSRECARKHQWVNRTGSRMEVRTCVICLKEFEIKKSRKDRACSMACAGKLRSQTCATRPPKPPREPKIRHCVTCGAEIIKRGGAKWCLTCRESGRQESARESYKKMEYIKAHRRLALDWQKRNPAKTVASRLARQYPELLMIIYECPCDTNGTPKHQHHYDYSRPYEILKLCEACHAKEEKRLRRLAATAAQNTPAEPFDESPVNARPPEHISQQDAIAGRVAAGAGTD